MTAQTPEPLRSEWRLQHAAIAKAKPVQVIGDDRPIMGRELAAEIVEAGKRLHLDNSEP